MADAADATDETSESPPKPLNPYYGSELDLNVFTALAGKAPLFGPPPPPPRTRLTILSEHLKQWCTQKWPQLSSTVMRHVDHAKARLGKLNSKR